MSYTCKGCNKNRPAKEEDTVIYQFTHTCDRGFHDLDSKACSDFEESIILAPYSVSNRIWLLGWIPILLTVGYIVWNLAGDGAVNFLKGEYSLTYSISSVVMAFMLVIVVGVLVKLVFLLIEN